MNLATVLNQKDVLITWESKNKFNWSSKNQTGILMIEPTRFVITQHDGRCLQLIANVKRRNSQ